MWQPVLETVPVTDTISWGPSIVLAFSWLAKRKAAFLTEPTSDKITPASMFSFWQSDSISAKIS
jgi:hypothetical protein